MLLPLLRHRTALIHVLPCVPSGHSYVKSLEAVKEAMARSEKSGVPIFRPADYYAEMMKSDHQMKKVCELCLLWTPCPHTSLAWQGTLTVFSTHARIQVKSRLLFEQRKIAAFEQRKRDQEARKFAREVRCKLKCLPLTLSLSF